MGAYFGIGRPLLRPRPRVHGNLVVFFPLDRHDLVLRHLSSISASRLSALLVQILLRNVDHSANASLKNISRNTHFPLPSKQTNKQKTRQTQTETEKRSDRVEDRIITAQADRISILIQF